ncbi:MAG: hypothetical protein KDA28_15525, partial [Phycisphaerales bacterium]|nr:hypothetical protein [Phycisphaerales bacterium]
ESVESRRAICEAISIFGNDDQVGNLAALLLEPALADHARNALERIGSTQARYALRQALDNVEGDQRLGIISSLGRLGDADTVDLIEPVTEQEIKALANIGGLKAFAKIRSRLDGVDQRARAGTTEALDALLIDAALRMATKIRDQGDTLTMFLDAAYDPWVRDAARRALIDHDRTADRLVETLKVAPALGLQIVRTTPSTPVVEDLASRLDELDREQTLAVLGALAERSTPTTSAGMLGLLESSDAEVRHAAMRLGANDPLCFPMLLNAIDANGDDADVAYLILLQERGDQVDDALAAASMDARTRVRTKALDALALRRADIPVTALFPLLDRNDTRADALRTIGAIARPSDVEALCARYASTRAPDLRRVIARLASTPEGGDRVLAAYRASNARTTLADLLPAVGGEEAFELLEDLPDAEAVQRGVLAWNDRAALPRLRTLVGRGVGGAHAAYLRILREDGGDEEDFTYALDLARTPEEKEDALRSLGAVPSKDTLDIALRLLAEERVKLAAADAVIAIAPRLEPALKEDALAALQQIMVIGLSQEQMANAGAAANVIERDDDYILSWVVAGPFQADGKNGPALYDHAFAPERDPDVADWTPMPTDRQVDPRSINLQEIGAGDNRCAYLRTRIHVDRPQPVRFEFGSDDGFRA